MSEGVSESVVEAPRETRKEAPAVRGGAVAFIFVTILLDMFALGIIMPILPIASAANTSICHQMR